MRRLLLLSKSLTVALWLIGVWAMLVPWACGDEVIRAGELCPSGHRYEPLRLTDRWVGLCYTGKDEKAAIARACSTLECAPAVGPTLADSVDRPVGGCMTCSRDHDGFGLYLLLTADDKQDILNYLIWKEIAR